MKEFNVAKKYLKLLKRTTSSVPFYFIFFLNFMYISVLFLLERNALNFVLVFLGMGILLYFKKKAQLYSQKIKNSKGSALLFHDNQIIYRKISGEEKSFQKDQCKFFRITQKYLNRKEVIIVLKADKFYFVGPIENGEDFLKYLTAENIPLKMEKKSSLLELTLILSGMLFLCCEFVFASTLAYYISLVFFSVSLSILFYRFWTSYYAKQLLVAKELAGFQRLMAPAFVMWGLCIGLAFLPLTQRDASLDKLHAVLDRIQFEKNPKAQEKLLYTFRDNYTKFKNEYPDDKSLNTVSQRFSGILKKAASRKVASEKSISKNVKKEDQVEQIQLDH